MAASPAVGVVSWHSEPGKQVNEYHNRVSEAGLEPVAMFETGQTLEGCAGLVLTGGVDIEPSLYGEPMHPRTKDCDPERDAFESALLREALERDLPVLAICRGHQLLNVVLGGSLLQHIEDWSHAAQQDEARTSAEHEVSVCGALCDLYGTERLLVNSRHHQAVTPERLAPGLETLAMSADGYVEGARLPQQRWVFGVQWHPERLEPQIGGFAPQSALLFHAFADAIRA